MPSAGPRVVVLGDLMIDVVIRPAAPPEPGTDVPGQIEIRAGGSAANTARSLARLGAQPALIAAVGRDPSGRALTAALEADGVRLHVARPARARTGRIGVLVATDGERAFVADRAAADALRASDVRQSWFTGVRLLHLPAYSFLSSPLREAAMRAVALARRRRAAVSLDLASSRPLLAAGRDAALALVRAVAPDVLFATLDEASALIVGLPRDGGPASADAFEAAAFHGDPWPAEAFAALATLAPTVVLKRGAAGATVLARGEGGRQRRLDVAARRIAVGDSTGAGDAFDAGFIVAWLAAGDGRDAVPAGSGGLPRIRSAAQLRRAVLAGHRAARLQLTARRPELPLL